jgi:hypothetical protein
MFHNHATPWRIYVTADKLRLNKAVAIDHPLILRQTAVPPTTPPTTWGDCGFTSTSTCLNFFKCYWLPSFPPSPGQLKRQVSCHMPALPNAGLCRYWNHYNQILATGYNFLVLVRDRVMGTDRLTAVSVLQNKYDTPPLAMKLRHSAVWNEAEMTLEINLYELTAPFEHCVLETEQMETQGNSFRFWNRKCIKWVKKLFHCQMCYFLGGKFSYAGMF